MGQSTEAASQSYVSDCHSAVFEKRESRKPWMLTAAANSGACSTTSAWNWTVSAASLHQTAGSIG